MATNFDIASQNSGGTLVGNPLDPSISADGNLVAFLAFDPVSSHNQAFVKNETTSVLTIVSSSAGGTVANSSLDLGSTSISTDGSTVVFSTDATNLIGGVPGGGTSEVFVKTLASGGLALASQTQGGVIANGFSSDGALSSNGVIVSFDSAATNLGLGGAGSQIYVKNMSTGGLALASQTQNGTIANGSSQNESISSDGNIVVFRSSATDLGSVSGTTEVYAKNMATGALSIVSQNQFGTIANASAVHASASGDGTEVSFDSTATNLLNGVSAGNLQVYVKNLTTGALTLASSSTNGTIANGQSEFGVVSADGRYVMFTSTATNLDPAATSGQFQTYIKDLQTGVLTLLSKTGAGVAGDNQSFPSSTAGKQAFSADDSKTVFETLANNLNGQGGAFTIERATTAPPAVGPNAVAGDDIVSQSELTAATFSGTSSAIGAAVTVALDTTSNILGTTTVAADGTWSITTNLTGTSQGSHTELVKVGASTSSYLDGSASRSFAINTTGPTTTFDTGVKFTSQTQAKLAGTVADPTGVTHLEIFDGATDLGAATVAADGTWKFTANLTRGVHDQLHAVATDGIGNTSDTAAPFLLQTGIRGAPYSTYEEDFAGGGIVTGETFSTARGKVYLHDDVTVQPSGDIVYNYDRGTFFKTQDFFFYTDVFTSVGDFASETLYNNDGTATVTGFLNNRTLEAVGNDTMTGGGRKVTFEFNPHPGLETITDFIATGKGHDTISLPMSQFTSIAQVLHNAVQQGNDTVITLDKHSSITLQNVAVDTLTKKDFALHA